MVKKTICDICDKEIGLRWFELIRHHKEMDYGMVKDEGTYEVCSKACLEKLIDRLKEFNKLEQMYDTPTHQDIKNNK